MNAAGLEALEKALYCWEDALTAFSSSLSNDTLALPSKADAAFTHDVQELLDMGYQIQSHAELLFIDQVGISVHLPSAFSPFLFSSAEADLRYSLNYYIDDRGACLPAEYFSDTRPLRSPLPLFSSPFLELRYRRLVTERLRGKWVDR